MTWTVNIRQPDVDERPLSAEEQEIARRDGEQGVGEWIPRCDRACARTHLPGGCAAFDAAVDRWVQGVPPCR